MKILISSDFYKHNLGGVTTSVLSLYTGLVRLGYEVKILTMSENRRSYRDGDVYLISSFDARYSPNVRMSVSINDPLLDELIKWRPDIIHVQSEGSALLFGRKIQKRCKVPLIITCHTDYAYFVFGEARKKPLFEAIAKITAWLVYHNVFKIVIPSCKSRDFPFLNAFKDRLLVLPNGIEISRYQRTLSLEKKKEIRASVAIPENAGILTAVTRLSKEKNLQELVSSLPLLLQKIPEAVLMLVGSGPYEEELRKLAERLGIKDKVFFIGYKPADEIGDYLAISDIYVSASLFEVHSMSHLEALAAGLPLLCKEDKSLQGVLENTENGYIYNTREEFAKLAEQILNNETLKEEMGAASLKRSLNFSCERFGRNAVHLYENVICEWNNRS